MAQPVVLILPGLNNSGPLHWQTAWEKEYGFIRVQQKDWDTPVCEDWINTLDAAILQYGPEKVVLVAHSLACCTIAHWVQKFNRSVKAAFLVGPSDVEAPSYPPGTTGFAPMPLQPFSFPSVVIASSNDVYVTPARARFFADSWQSRFIMIGQAGHINSDSNLGKWQAGIDLLETIAPGVKAGARV
ncbi:MAG: alpha/beta hydrolase [Chitinophagaceae bacterium]